MRITESQLRRIIRQEVRALTEAPDAGWADGRSTKIRGVKKALAEILVPTDRYELDAVYDFVMDVINELRDPDPRSSLGKPEMLKMFEEELIRLLADNAELGRTDAEIREIASKIVAKFGPIDASPTVASTKMPARAPASSPRPTGMDRLFKKPSPYTMASSVDDDEVEAFEEQMSTIAGMLGAPDWRGLREADSDKVTAAVVLSKRAPVQVDEGGFAMARTGTLNGEPVVVVEYEDDGFSLVYKWVG